MAIFGDYDVDGATSAALLVLLLRTAWRRTDRLHSGPAHGGLRAERAKPWWNMKTRGASVAVCVDCGAQAFEALEEARAAELM